MVCVDLVNCGFFLNNVVFKLGINFSVFIYIKDLIVRVMYVEFGGILGFIYLNLNNLYLLKLFSREYLRISLR